MGMAELDEALDIISSYGEHASFVGPRDEALIVAAEDALCLSLPPSYRAFVKRLGAGDFAGEELFGVIHGDFQASGVPDGVWMTLQAREAWNLPGSMVVVYFDGGTDYYALDVDSSDSAGEAPVVAWRPGVSEAGDRQEVVAADFGVFLLDLIRRASPA